jgi:homoserine O-acetyltransferase
VRIGDDVRAQYKFVTEKFDLKSLALVVGGSMGAQQTYEWAVRYPDMVKRAAPIAGTAKKYHPRFSIHGNAGRGDHI